MLTALRFLAPFLRRWDRYVDTHASCRSCSAIHPKGTRCAPTASECRYGPRVGAGVACYLDEDGTTADVYRDRAVPGGLLVAVNGQLAALPPEAVADLVDALAAMPVSAERA